MGGQEDGLANAKSLRRHLSKLRAEKAALRRRRMRQRARMQDLVSTHQKQLRRQSWHGRIQEDDLRHKIYSLEAKLREIKKSLAHRQGSQSWLATIHHFLVEQMGLMQAQIEADSADITRLQLAFPQKDKGTDFPPQFGEVDSEQPLNRIEELDTMMMEICNRKRTENAARLAQIQA